MNESYESLMTIWLYVEDVHMLKMQDVGQGLRDTATPGISRQLITQWKVYAIADQRQHVNEWVQWPKCLNCLHNIHAYMYNCHYA